MSAPHPALTSGEQTALNTPNASRLWLLGIPLGTPFATADVASGVTWPLKDIPVTGASAGWTNARVGMTVWIGSAALGKDKGVFFVRKALISNRLYIGEIQRPDTGLATVATHTTPIVAGDHVTIWETYNLAAMRSKIAYSVGSSSGTFYKNTDLGYSTQNTVPKPYFQGTNHAAVRLPDGASTISKVYNANPQVLRGGQSIISYAWTIPASWVVTGGSLSSNTFTADIPEGFHVVYCLVQTNDGATETLIRYLWVYSEDGTLQPTPLALNYADVRDRSGRRLSVQLHDNSRQTIDTESMVIVIEESTWSGGAVATATTVAVGWLQNADGETEFGRKGSMLEILGPAAVLHTLGADSQRLTQDATPANWQEAPVDLMTVTYFIWYLLRWGVMNFASLFNYFPLTAGQPQTVNPLDAQKGTYLSQLQALAQRCAYANLGCDSDGDLHVHEHPSLLPTASRTTLITRDVLTGGIYSRATYPEPARPTTRRVVANGFAYDGVTMQAYRAQAPGKASGQASGEEELLGIITSSQATLNLFAGLYYQKENQKFPEFTFTIPGNRDVYEPAYMQRVSFTLEAAYSPTGVVLSGYGIPVSVSKRRNEQAAIEITLVLEVETNSVQGEVFPYPPSVESSPYGPSGDIPYQDYLPPGGDGWGAQNDFNPTVAPASNVKFILLAQNAGATEWRVVRVDSIDPSFQATDISPSSAQRTLLGQAIKIARIPRVPKGLVLVCEKGLAVTSNCTGAIVTWTVPSLVYTNSPDHMYDVQASFAKAGRYYWLGRVQTGGLPISLPGTYDWIHNYDLKLGLYGWTDEDSQWVAGHGIYLPSVARWDHLGRISKSSDLGVTGVLKFIALGMGSWPTNPSGGGVNPQWFWRGGNSWYDASLVGQAWLQKEVNWTYGAANEFSGTQYQYTNAAVSGVSEWNYLILAGTGDDPFAGDPEPDVVDDIYLYYTLDNFQTIQETLVATADTITPCLGLSPFTAAFVWASAGTPAGDAAIYFSSNFGASLVAGATLYPHGGSFRIPRSLPGGGANKLAHYIPYVQGVNTDLMGVKDGSTPAIIAVGGSDYPITPNTLSSFMLDSNYVLVGLASRDVYGSDDGGETWTFIGAAPGAGQLYSLEVWPTNRHYVLVAGDQCLAYSIDRGLAFTTLWADFAAWATAEYGAGVATVILIAQQAWWAVYTKVVI